MDDHALRVAVGLIGALENTVTDLSFKVDSSPASGTLGNDKCRIPSVLFVYKCYFNFFIKLLWLLWVYATKLKGITWLTLHH